MSRLRSELGRRGLAERLLAGLNRQPSAKGLMVKVGTLIDTALVEADCRRPRRGERVADRSDQDASWNAMPEQPLFGYKMPLAVDHGSGLVRRAILRQSCPIEAFNLFGWRFARIGRGSRSPC